MCVGRPYIRPVSGGIFTDALRKIKFWFSKRAYLYNNFEYTRVCFINESH